jgi:hypothetical protein
MMMMMMMCVCVCVCVCVGRARSTVERGAGHSCQKGVGIKKALGEWGVLNGHRGAESGAGAVVAVARRTVLDAEQRELERRLQRGKLPPAEAEGYRARVATIERERAALGTKVKRLELLARAHRASGAAAVASFLAAVLTEIYLCGICSCQEILRRSGRG